MMCSLAMVCLTCILWNARCGAQVNSDQVIGLLKATGTHPKNLQCNGNTPKATCKASIAHRTASNWTTMSSFHVAGTYRSPSQTCGAGEDGVVRLTNPGLNFVQVVLCTQFDNVSNACNAAGVRMCNAGPSLVPPNASSAKFYNISSANLQAIAFVPWSTQALSFHKLHMDGGLLWGPIPPHSEPEITVQYSGLDKGVLCDSTADCFDGTCSSGVCKSNPTPPPPPPPPPAPPIVPPTAATCVLTGAWRQKGAMSTPPSGSIAVPPTLRSTGGEINVTATGAGAFAFTCASHDHECPGGLAASNGTGTLATSGQGVSVKLFNGTTYTGVVNSTYLCNLITFLAPAPSGGTPVTWERTLTRTPPPFDLKVTPMPNIPVL